MLLRWSEVHRDALVLADSKTGARKVPLNSQARSILERQPRDASPFVFPSPLDPSRPRHPNLTLWHRVRRQANIEDVRLHDLRHTFASHAVTVGKWRRRFVAERIEGLSDEPRPGRPRTIEDEQVARVIERTLTATPVDATHWSLRSMARESGLSHTTIWRIWGAFGFPVEQTKTGVPLELPIIVDDDDAGRPV